jgi:outer membrane beta-barrel protein
MKSPAVTLVTSLVLVSLSDAHATSDVTVRFALVVGHNRAEGKGRADLRYADDDAVATHRLLVRAGVRSVLLARLDADTRALNPRLVPDGPPRWGELAAALKRLRREMRASAREGARPEFILFYSGHGDVSGGEGYVLLEDRRLTRSLLYGVVLSGLPTARNHVVVDACKSYYLAFDKGPGGKRAPYHRSFIGAPSRPRNTGFVLSTSSDRDSHEWERFQAGVFSHEVRSALQGGGDADNDGRITYAELGAFLRTANRGISNPRFRPDFVIRPPGHPSGNLAQPFLSWPRPDERSAALVVDRPGHLYLEDVEGRRLLDVNAASGQSLMLRLPRERLFLRRADNSREYGLELGEAGGGTAGGAAGGRTVRLSRLRATPLSLARRGAMHLALERLFAGGFSKREVAEFVIFFERECLPPGAAPPAVVVSGTDPLVVRLSHELDTEVGILPADLYTTSLQLSVGYAWHMTRLWALQLRLAYLRSYAKDLREQLEENFGIHRRRFAEIDYFGEIGVLFKPIHGRLFLFEGYATHWEVFLSAAAVVGRMEGGDRTEREPSGRGPRVFVGGASGIGLRWILTRSVSLRSDLRQMVLHADGDLYYPLAVTLGLAVNIGGDA